MIKLLNKEKVKELAQEQIEPQTYKIEKREYGKYVKLELSIRRPHTCHACLKLCDDCNKRLGSSVRYWNGNCKHENTRGCGKEFEWHYIKSKSLSREGGLFSKSLRERYDKALEELELVAKTHYKREVDTDLRTKVLDTREIEFVIGAE